MTHSPVIPRVVHLGPGETVARWCTCQTITGGRLVDNPACEMHHSEPALYIFTVPTGSAAHGI